ncbi:hemin ABC transporter substrate-binding protein [Hyphomicrobium sp. MC1]|uniref:heme/hemin ABC transporter substrate-binding protein n=1 Tax=Hyphomicrobium sp. (strain MC1) TaxID=717785 RepID=UPI000213E22E|nr:ABC transporter substrate-binding protein [Hyphomicrobium sp. MC1]CCB67660.1 Periplasmic binding protein [Hyphomicrobium sp. MC1]
MRVATRLFIMAGVALAAAATASFSHRAMAADASAGTPRILSIGGDITEILYDLGQQDKIVAVDVTSQFPPEALKEKKSVGYMRALSAEGTLSVNPTLIIASDGAGPPEVVNALKSSGVRYVDIADKPSAEGVPAKIRHIGSVVGADDAAKALASKVEFEFAALENDRKQIKTRKKALFILAIQNGRATVAGAGTSADSILQLAGVDNAAAGVNGFKPVSDEQLTEFAPDVVVMMRRGTTDDHNASQALSLPGLSQSPAAQTKSLIAMDGLYLLGFGPRAPWAARDLMKAIYAEGGHAAATP